MTWRVLVTDQVDPEGVALLTGEPALQVDERPTLPPDELLRCIGEHDAIVGRSATRISAELLRHAPRLKVVGRAGVGVDNIALDTATALGVAVINAPAGNTVAVAELVAEGFDAEAVLAAGDPGREICACAQREGCDLIAMGTHGHTGLNDLLRGSVANEVRHRTLVPVLMVRDGSEG